MNDSEALKALSIYHDVVVGDDGTLIDNAMKVAIEALEKWIPKVPKGDYPFYCPMCGTKLIPDPHCGRCGQLIDWDKVRGK